MTADAACLIVGGIDGHLTEHDMVAARLFAYNWQHEHKVARVMSSIRDEFWAWECMPEDECLDAPDSIPAGNICKVESTGVQKVRMLRREPLLG